MTEMKRNELDEAVEDYICIHRSSLRAVIKTWVAPSFKAGAEWQRNHVWHGITEQPEEPKLVLAITVHGAIICGPYHEDWKGTVDHFKIRTWAYVDDLKPTSFDEIIEANKDVLKRMEGNKE